MELKRREFLKVGGAGSLALVGSKSPLLAESMSSLTDMVSDLEPVPAEEYSGRIEKARLLMAESGYGAFFVEGGSSLDYFTGVQWGRSERTFGAVIPKNGRVAFVCPAFEKGRAMERVGSLDAEVRIWEEHQRPFEVIAGILADRGLRSGEVAVEPTTRNFIVVGMGGACPTVGFNDGSDVTDGCRMIKSELELRYMRRADEITKKAYRVAAEGLKEGMTPSELGQLISSAHSRMGVRGGALVLFGPASAFPHGTRDVHHLKEGDVVLMDGGCSVRGYRSDVTRTLVFGKPSDKQRKIWDVVHKAQEAALAAARPGVTCGELDRVARQVIDESGYGPGYRYFTHRLGHGIGMDGHEAPYLVQGNSLPLEPGMTFSDEPGIYIEGEFGIRHEDVLVVTEDGAESLSDRRKQIGKLV